MELIENKSVSPSRISMLNHCSQKHYYAYGLGLERPGETWQQALGTAVHRAIEDMYAKKPVPRMDSLAETWADKYNACVDSFGTFSLLQDSGVQIIATEKEFEIPVEDERIGEGWTVKGIIDVVCVINGQLWVADHKTTGRKWPIEKTSLALQHKLYELAVTEMYPGYEYGGSFYNFIQYGERAGKAYANTERVFLPRNDAGLNTAWEEMISAIQRIESGQKFRNTGEHCKWCDFYILCQSDYFGGDTEAAIELNYQKKKPKDPVIELEE